MSGTDKLLCCSFGSFKYFRDLIEVMKDQSEGMFVILVSSKGWQISKLSDDQAVLME